MYVIGIVAYEAVLINVLDWTQKHVILSQLMSLAVTLTSIAVTC